MTSHLRIGWITTANGPGSRGMYTAVADAVSSGELQAKFEFVFVNRERGQTGPTDSFLDLVEEHNVSLVTLSSLRFRRRHGNPPWRELREAYDKAVLSRLQGFDPDVSVMAGYMLFAPEISRWMRLLNQHPALPGGTIGKWQDAIWDVIEKGETHHGSMMHIATPELDRGPVISTCRFSVRGPEFDHLWDAVRDLDIAQLRRDGNTDLPLFLAIREAGVKREQLLVVETLKAVSSGEIDLERAASGGAFEPLDMT